VNGKAGGPEYKKQKPVTFNKERFQMSQMERDKNAVRTVLKQTGGTYFDDIALRGGEGLWPAVKELHEAGEIIASDEVVPALGKSRRVYRLKLASV